MNEISPILTVDYSSLFISIFSILIGIKATISLLEWFMNKLGIETKWMREKREGKELLAKTAEGLALLQKKHVEDVHESDEHDKQLKNDLTIFMNEIRSVVSDTQNELKQFAENRVRDREQSLKIQKELTNSIVSISNNEKERSKQIEALMCGSKELLGAEIDKRYREYISLGGIPELEVGEFDDIFVAYKALMGNHSRDTKYNYIKNHLRVIPVETKLVIN